jgi:hypothetical protein
MVTFALSIYSAYTKGVGISKQYEPILCYSETPTFGVGAIPVVSSNGRCICNACADV